MMKTATLDGDAGLPFDLAIVDEDHEPLASFNVLRSPPAATSGARLNRHSISRFNQLLSAIPQTSAKLAADSKQLVVCDIPFDKLIKAKDGQGSLGISSKPDSSLFDQHVRLNKPESLRDVVNTGLMLNLVSTLVAQQHLAEISEKLERIQAGVERIQVFLNDERKSALLSFCERIDGCLTTISNGESISPFTLQSVASSRDKIRAITLHLEKDFENRLADLRKFDSTSRFGSDGIRKDLQERLKSLATFYQEYTLGMQCLVMANLILYVHSDFAGEFVRDAQALMAKMDARGGVRENWAAIQNQLSIHLNKMRPLFELTSSTDANAMLVRSSIQDVSKSLSTDINALSELGARLTAEHSQKIVLEVDGGQVVGGFFRS